MDYALATLAPPIGVYVASKNMQRALIAAALTACFWLPGVIYAWQIVDEVKER